MKVWYRVRTFNLNNHVNICITACRKIHLKSGRKKNELIKWNIFQPQTRWKICTFEILFQFVDHFSVLHKRNSIEINLIVHTKFNILPVFIWDDKNRQRNDYLYHFENEKNRKQIKWQSNTETIEPVIEGRFALFPRTFKWRLDFNSPPSITSHFTKSFVFDFTANDIIPPVTQDNPSFD